MPPPLPKEKSLARSIKEEDSDEGSGGSRGSRGSAGRPTPASRRSSSTYTFSRPPSLGSLDLSEQTSESPPLSPGRGSLVFPLPALPGAAALSPRRLFSAYSEPMPSSRGAKPRLRREEKQEGGEAGEGPGRQGALRGSPPLLSSSSPSKSPRRERNFRRRLRNLSIEEEMMNVQQITQILSSNALQSFSRLSTNDCRPFSPFLSPFLSFCCLFRWQRGGGAPAPRPAACPPAWTRWSYAGTCSRPR